MSVRKANEQDIAFIGKLLYQVASVHSEGRPDLFKRGAKKYTDDDLREILSDPSRPVFIGERDGKAAGYAFCVIEDYAGDNVRTPIKTLYIDDICVDESCRGQGIGRMIFEGVKEYAREIGCYDITLNVWECNPSAAAFYRSLGMTAYKTGLEFVLT
ncbi:MAG: GNAT family N-acetyltransferase [Ruminococcus sp.]|nr:GNAT family N-acetyltransferase [Ruminococcus sp.]